MSYAIRLRRAGVPAVILLAVFCWTLPLLHAELASFPTAALTIDTRNGPHRFSIEVARTALQMEQGLMYRRTLAPDSGMLFVFDAPQIASFWMKNTLIPLDMLFIAADGRVADIHERAVPLSLDPIDSSVPVLAVLELNGGTVARLGIARGDRIIHSAFAGPG